MFEHKKCCDYVPDTRKKCNKNNEKMNILYLADQNAKSKSRLHLNPTVTTTDKYSTLLLPSIIRFLHLVDPDDPVLGRVRLLHMLEFELLIANLRVAHTIVARRFA